MDKFFTTTYTNLIYHPFLNLIVFLTSQKSYLIILFIVFIGLVTLSSKIKHKVWTNILGLLGVLCLLLTLYVGYIDYRPEIKDFFKTGTKETTPNAPSSTKPGNQTTPSSPNSQSTPSYQAPKQLYYSINCSSCWAEGCPNNGYNYSGYDSYYYTYYTALCRACSCNSLNGRSFWR